ncbi:MAG: RDD family protein [Candidatus Hodarchaeales archaeon]
MSMKRIEYEDAPMVLRLIALIIDIIIGVIIAFLVDLGWVFEYDIFWSKILNLEGEAASLVVLWFVISFPIYHILMSSLTNGQSGGKLLLGIRVVTETNESTKRMFMLHFKRFFFMRTGTKVVKEVDPTVKGL